jgi:PmbA protein
MSEESMRDVAIRAVELARAKGAGEAAASGYRVRQVDVTWRDGRVEKITEATTRGLGVDLYVDGRYASVSTSDLRPEALDRFIGESVALTRKLAPDLARRLPDPELYQGQAELELQLEDPHYGEVDPASRRRTAEAMETAARGVAGAKAILSASASYGDMLAEKFQVHSNGFEGHRRATDFWASCEVSVQDPDGRRPEDWDAAGSRHLAQLVDPAQVGRKAALRALGRIGSQKGESAVLPMVVENRAAGRLVSMLLGPLAASLLQQKRSFLEGKLGARIGSELLSLSDEPLVVRGLGSRLFDGEGLAAKPFPIFEQGALRNYYVDTYYGRKLGMAPTTGRTSNLTWGLGQKPLSGLLADMGEGILVTGFLGGNSNSTTGDFSLGVQGYRVRAGQPAEPVGEMNVSGNQLELWTRLVGVGSDPYPYSPIHTPTLMFEGVQFAGR